MSVKHTPQLNRLLAAIVADDASAAQRLLAAAPALARQSLAKPKLYRAGIFHWIYAGDTALHLAAAGYRTRIVRWLLAAGADPNAAANHRRSGPLHYAADGYITGPAWDARRQVQTIRLLLAAGADVNAADKNGATPLHRAVRTRCAAAVKCLLEAGGDLALENNSGSTPLHLAVQNTGRGGSGEPPAVQAQRQIVTILLDRGADARLKNSQGKSAADSARSQPIRELLAQSGD